MQIFSCVNFLSAYKKIKNKKFCDPNMKYVFMNNHFPELMQH